MLIFLFLLPSVRHCLHFPLKQKFVHMFSCELLVVGCINETHSLLKGWRWSRRFQFLPRDDFHQSEVLWFAQKRSPACQYLWNTNRQWSTEQAACQWQCNKWQTTESFTFSCQVKTSQLNLTQHLADIRLNINILEVLVCVCMVETQGRVEPDRHPDTITDPC